MLDFIRIACAVPPVKVGDVQKNARDICACIEKADAQNADLIVFPEMSLTGYTCQDLFHQELLHQGVKAGMKEIAACSKDHPGLTIVVGLPVRVGMQMFNCAAVVVNGSVTLTAKRYIPNYNEFYEKRWFNSGADLPEAGIRIPGSELGLEQEELLLGNNLIFTIGDGTRVGV